MSLEHAVEHYRQGKDADRAFFILHLDHAVELVLKERLWRAGQSLVKKGGRTLVMAEALDGLEERCAVEIKERADLELLHDFRNQLQHSGVTLDSFQMEHHATTTFLFFRRFLQEELGVDIESVLERYVLEELARAEEQFIEKKLSRVWKKVLSWIELKEPGFFHLGTSRKIIIPKVMVGQVLFVQTISPSWANAQIVFPVPPFPLGSSAHLFGRFSLPV